MEERKMFTLGQLFTPQELAKASGIVRVRQSGKMRLVVSQLEAEVVKPAMTRIDKLTGQENSPRYLAYQLFHHLS